MKRDEIDLGKLAEALKAEKSPAFTDRLPETRRKAAPAGRGGGRDPAAHAAFLAGIERDRNVVGALASPYVSWMDVVDLPFLIWHFQPKPDEPGRQPFENVLGWDFEYAPGASKARIGLHTRKYNHERSFFGSEAAFIYLWTNPADHPVVVDLEAGLTFDGYYAVSAHPHQEPWNGTNVSQIKARLWTSQAVSLGNWFGGSRRELEAALASSPLFDNENEDPGDDEVSQPPFAIDYYEPPYEPYVLRNRWNYVQPHHSLVIRVSAFFEAFLVNGGYYDTSEFLFFDDDKDAGKAIHSPLVKLTVRCANPI